MLAIQVHSRRKQQCTPSTLGFYNCPRVWRKLARPAQAKRFALIYSPSAEQIKLQPKMHVTRLGALGRCGWPTVSGGGDYTANKRMTHLILYRQRNSNLPNSTWGVASQD